ncbi:MAG: serine/threonine protein kinase-related protein [Limisphaerales bacterium]|nr:MAG: serine/threonine protein kinase-related protein [Limisphaerales bacterium]KAG0509457.1 MAG: serine/threonine protein kinase-related protein [Limisphaerales bacterium]TXT52294.1 MAG: serine/threonine protein kinase-related protein [Limisphaerales bacterium]
MPVTQSPICRNCGKLPEPGSPLGLCSRCLMQRLFDARPATSSGRETKSGPASQPANKDFRVLRELAQGGMGTIFEAAEPGLDRTVAMKVLRHDSRLLKGGSERFLREARVLALLEHPNIVPIHALGQDAEGRPFYTMKRVRGQTLQAVINQLRRGDRTTLHEFSLDKLLTVFLKVCDAIAFAHSRGIIHRDLKPENIMVGEFGEVLVMDWGLAKFEHDHLHEIARDVDTEFATRMGMVADEEFRPSDSGLTMDGAVMGTPQFMPPEQAAGKIAEIDARSDVFALGAILYCILTLRPPFRGKNLNEVLHKVRSGAAIKPPTVFNRPPTKPGERGAPAQEESSPRLELSVGLAHCPNGRVPAALSGVTMRALEFKPANRYQTVTALSVDITAYRGGFATSVEHVGALGQVWLLALRHRLAASLLGVMVVLTAVFIVQLVRSERSATQHAEKAEKNEQRATSAQQQTELMAGDLRRSLSHAYVSEGWKLQSDGAPFRALPVFTKALELEAADPERTAINRLRLSVLMSQSPGLLQFFNPGGTITDADLITDAQGTRLALGVAGTNGTFSAGVWNPADGRLLTPLMSHAGRVNSVRFDRAGDRLVTAGEDKFVRVWDARKGTLILGPLKHGEAVWQAVFSPDGKWIASSDNHKPGGWGALSGGEALVYRRRNGTTTLWNAATGKPRWETPVEGRNAQLLVFSPDGTQLAEGYHTFVSAVTRVTDGEIVSHFPEIWWVNDIVYSVPANRVVACGLWTQQIKPGARLFEAATLAPIGEMLPHEQEVYCAAFTPDGRLFATGGRDRLARVFDSATSAPMLAGLAHAAPVTRLEFSTDGSQLAAGCENGDVRVWDPRTGTPLSPWLPHDSAVLRLRFEARGERLLTVTRDGVRTWDLRTGAVPRHVFPETSSQQVVMEGFDQSGKHVFSFLRATALLRLWSVATGRLVEAPLRVEGGRDPVGYDPERRLVFTFLPGEGVRTLNMRDGSLAAAVLAPQHRLLNPFIHWSSDGRIVLAGSRKEFQICDADDGRVRQSLTSQTTGITARWGALGDRAALELGGGKYQVMDLLTGKVQWTGTYTARFLAELLFSPDGKLLAVRGQEDQTQVFDARTGAPVTPVLRRAEAGAGAAFSPNSQRIATAGADGAVRIWSAADGRPLTDWLRHRSAVIRVRFSHDGRLLLSASTDRTVIAWDAVTGDLVAPPYLHETRINGLHLSADGRHFLTMQGVDRSMRLWAMPMDNPAFTAADWRKTCRLFGGSENRPEPGQPDIVPAEQAANWLALATRHPLEFHRAEAGGTGWLESSAWAAWKRGDWERAVQDYGRVIQADPGASDQRMMRATAALRAAETLTGEPRTARLRTAVEDVTQTLAWLAGSGPHAKELRGHLLEQRSHALYAQGDFTAARGDFGAAHDLPAAASLGKGSVDLSTWFNARSPADEETRGRLKPFLDRGTTALAEAGGLAFDVRALVHLRGPAKNALPHQPERIAGIPVGRACAKLHFLHGHANLVSARTEVGSYVIRYTDGGSETIPLISGVNTGPWALPATVTNAPPRANEVWKGESQRLNNRVPNRLRVLLHTWTNPHPTRPIAALDFVSAGTDAAPFLIAVTGE